MNEREKWLVKHGWLYGVDDQTLEAAIGDVPKDIHNAPADPRDARNARLEGLLREAMAAGNAVLDDHEERKRTYPGKGDSVQPHKLRVMGGLSNIIARIDEHFSAQRQEGE